MKIKLTALIFSLAMLASSTVAQNAVLRVSTRQVRDIIASLERRTDDFKTEMRRSFNISNANPANREDRIMDLIEEFEDSTDQLRNRFNSRQTVDRELNEVYSDAQTINSFMIRNRMTGRSETLWSGIRNDLNTLGGYYTLSWTWNGPVVGQPVGDLPFSGNESQTRALIQRIENKTDTYKNRMGNALDRSAYDGRTEEQEIRNYISEFENATNRLRNRFNNRQSTGADASEVLNRGLYIDQFMARNAFARPAENQWRTLKADLDTLASYYRVSWNWNQTLPTNPVGGFPGQNRFLTGTYRLNRSMSDNVSNVINRSLTNISSNQRDNLRRNLERRLESPEMIAIDINGRMVELASSNAPRVTFEADGVGHSETNPRGRTVRTTSRVDRNGLNIAYEGDRMNDFYVTFSPRGDRLNVTRRLYLENRNETVTVSSVYDRVSNDPDWTAVNSRPDWNPNNNGGPISSNDFYIPNGTRLSATLRGTVNTRASQVGDRFVMVVDSPSQYRGAELEGTIAQADSSRRFTGRANVVLNFDTVRLNGRAYRFAGIIDGVTAYNGDRITVNNEGAISDRSRTTQTVTRAGIGAALGAIIGAIAGGGSGAAIGAGVGAGVGAGSVLITGRDTIELGPGSRFDITAYAPAGRVGG